VTVVPGVSVKIAEGPMRVPREVLV